MSGPDSSAFAKALKYFEFDKHKAHRWLLLERSRRESILREAGLLGVIQWQEQPLHVGNIVRVQESHEWGHAVFHGVIPEFDDEPPSSVYAAFDYLIRQCGIFPAFISLADLSRCSRTGLRALPVYGLRFDLEELDTAPRHAALKTMRQLLNIEPRTDLLIDQASEVTDAELFEQYFRDLEEKKAQLHERGQSTAGDSSLTLDDVDIWHT